MHARHRLPNQSHEQEHERSMMLLMKGCVLLVDRVGVRSGMKGKGPSYQYIQHCGYNAFC